VFNACCTLQENMHRMCGCLVNKRGGEGEVISFFLPIASHSEPQPKHRRPRHWCAHPAHRKYMVGSQTKYASYRNIPRSLRKLSTGMVVASALWRWSFWKHYQAYRRLIRSAQRCVNCSLYHCMHCSWSDRHFMEESNKIHSFIAWVWIWGRNSRGKNAKRRMGKLEFYFTFVYIYKISIIVANPCNRL